MNYNNIRSFGSKRRESMASVSKEQIKIQEDEATNV